MKGYKTSVLKFYSKEIYLKSECKKYRDYNVYNSNIKMSLVALKDKHNWEAKHNISMRKTKITNKNSNANHSNKIRFMLM